MLELTRTTVEVKLDGKTYTLRMPTYKEGVQYRADVAKNKEDDIKCAELLITYLSNLGFPAEVSESLETNHLVDILDFIQGAKKKVSSEDFKLAKLCSFYQLSPFEILEMTEAAVNSLWECITMIEAQNQLNLLSAMDWPNSKSARRKKIHKELFSKAFPKEEKPVEAVTQDDLLRVLGVKRG